MTKEQLQQEYNLTDDQYYGREKINGDLDLDSVTELPEGFNPTVVGSLYLQILTSIPEGFSPTVGGSLYLSSLTSIPEGFNPTVGDYLDLSSLTSIPKGFNPTVGGALDLPSLTSIPERFNPIVGDRLGLQSLTSIPKGFNPIVGDKVYYDNQSKTFSPSLGDNYIKRDNKLYKIITQKKNKKFRVVNVIQVGTNKGFILIFDHNNNLIKEMPL